MIIYNDEIRKISFDLLKNGIVDVIIGYRKGTVPMMNNPCIIDNVSETSSLVWDSNCRINLANYIVDRNDKIGIITKGCDSRNIVTHILENKIKREQLYIVGISCKGMLDRKKIEKKFSKEIVSVSESENDVTVEDCYGVKKSINKKDVMQNNCSSCLFPNPVISDVIVGDKVDLGGKRVDEYLDVKEIKKMSFNERDSFFNKLFSYCIRCYACRDACPLCYCPTCFVDESNPQWIGKSIDISDVKIFHFLRAYHCAGRCTDCGTCEQVCPLGINMRILTRKLAIDCKENFNWEAGVSSKVRPPLDIYSIEDPDDFIK